MCTLHCGITLETVQSRYKGPGRMEVAHQFYDARVTDLLAAQGLLTKAVETGALPDWQQVPGSVLYTSLAAAVAVQLVVLSLFGKGRRLVMDTTETILVRPSLLLHASFCCGWRDDGGRWH